MDRRLWLFPAAAVTAWAQQPSPAAAAAEQAVRARAEKFFQLAVDKKYREAEAIVADDTKDYYYDGNRPTMKKFHIDRIELSDNNTRARITITASVVMAAPNMPAVDLDAPDVSTWKFENGEWRWYVDLDAPIATPFGTMKRSKGTPANLAELMAGKTAKPEELTRQISIDRTEVVLTAGTPVQTITISNGMPGPAILQLQTVKIEGLVVELDSKDIAARGTATVRFSARKGSKPNGKVGFDVLPLGEHFDISVSSK